MDRSNTITLVSVTYTQDALGQSIPTESKRKVFCSIQSVSRAEWAAAGQLGLKPDLVAVMFAPEYHGEEIAELRTSGITESPYLLDDNGKLLEDDNKKPLRGERNDSEGTVMRYGIYRTYRSTNERIELYMERKTGVSNG